MERIAVAPGRVNLIGDHTDYTGGLVLPMAVPLQVRVRFRVGGDRIRLRSAGHEGEVDLPLPVPGGVAVGPAWARLAAAVAQRVAPLEGGIGEVEATLPAGAGLSSSAAFAVAVALALGHPPEARRERALLAQAAEHEATGVPCGIMDQLVVSEALEGAALFIDCRTLETRPVALPDGLVVHAVHSGLPRTLAGSAYAERRAACEAAAALVGPLRDADLDTIAGLPPHLARRARHVVTENARVAAFADALVAGDATTAGRLMLESHRSLAEDFEVSTPGLDELVARLGAIPGVHGARLTGAGFGGCVVALADASAPADRIGGWRLRPAGAATVTTVG